MQSNLNAFTELLEVYDYYEKTSDEIMGNISSQIWEAESAIRNADMVSCWETGEVSVTGKLEKYS